MDATPAPIQALLDLFATSLSGVRFGDLDSKALTTLAADVQSAAEVVASAEAALTSARDALKQRQDALLQQAHRALAYARVFAENDEALSARIEEISLPKPPRRTRSADEAPAPTPEPQAARPRKNASKAAPSSEAKSAIAAPAAE
jgi:hypothetical protein